MSHLSREANGTARVTTSRCSLVGVGIRSSGRRSSSAGAVGAEVVLRGGDGRW